MRHELIHIGSQILARWKSEIVKKQKKKNLIKLGELANSAIMDIKLG
jgi:hypothetical protein